MKYFLQPLLAAAVLAARAAANSNSTFSPFRPPAIPLAVRSPYLNTWLQGDEGLLPGSWPRFWTNQITGWQGFVRVDNATYNWMGGAPAPAGLVTQTAFAFTATESTFRFDVAGQVELTARFLSPVYPHDLLAQSLQFAYLDLAVASADGQPHRVQIYTDVSGEWASADSSKTLRWDGLAVESRVALQRFGLAAPAVLSETADMADWGDWFYATAAAADDDERMTFRTGAADTDTRAQFVRDGRLDGTTNTTFRAVRDAWPVFAYAHDLGVVVGGGGGGGPQEPPPPHVLLSVGVVQDPVVRFQGNSSAPEALAGLWTTAYASPAAAAAAFFRAWPAAAAYAADLDAAVAADAAKVGRRAGDDYAALVTLALRQVFGGLQAAHGTRQDYLFLKEISSDGDAQTVDVLFPTHPALLYLNPELLRLLLDPLFENQESGHYPNPWAMHDLGVFPNAVGYPAGNDEAMPLEECGDMIMMALAYALKVDDEGRGAAYMARHWPLLDRWAQRLVSESLVPAAQLSTDDFAGALANQTNLALKGILSVGAMVPISIAAAMGRGMTQADIDAVIDVLDADEAAEAAEIVELGYSPEAVAVLRAALRYHATAERYVEQWQALGAINTAARPPHATLAYQDPDSHGLLYNLYMDDLLELDLVPRAVYAMQSAFYASILEPYGVPLDSRHDWAKADWQAFAAAVADPDVRTAMIARLADFAAHTNSSRPLTDLYDAATGAFPADGPTFVARPVVGAFFALLALGVR